MDNELIRTHKLTRIYGSGENAVHALDGVDLSVQAGELLAVMGPSGCGKSTLLNMLGALDQPSEGEVWVAGENLAKLKDVDNFRARTVGFVFQLHNLLPTLTALENVEVPMHGQGLSRSQRQKRAGEFLELVGLHGRAGHLPNQLSGGQRQRVAVARALANDPALILADEPTGSLDSQSGEELLGLLADLNRSQGTTLIIVTHDRRVAQITQRVLRMQDGRIVDDHRIQNPLEEDLRMLVHSKLGQAVLGHNGASLDLLDPQETKTLRRLLQRMDTSRRQTDPESPLDTADGRELSMPEPIQADASEIGAAQPGRAARPSPRSHPLKPDAGSTWPEGAEAASRAETAEPLIIEIAEDGPLPMAEDGPLPMAEGGPLPIEIGEMDGRAREGTKG